MQVLKEEMKMKINKIKFIVRILELIVFILTAIFTPMAIDYANILRGHQAFGGEYLIPVLGLLIILIIETAYEDYEESKKKRRKK